MSNKLKPALIGFVPGGLPVDEHLEVLKSYAEIGYQATETGTFLFNEGDPVENLKKLNSFGMKTLALSFPGGGTIADVPEMVRKVRILGVDRVALFVGCVGSYRFGGRELPPTYDEVMQEIEDLNAIAKELGKEGITLTFHNHDAEFKSYYNGKPAYYLMLENSEYLKFEVDCGWVLYGGFCPVQVLKDTGDKLGAVHIKDYTTGNVKNPSSPIVPGRYEVPMPHFTMPGTGFLPLKDCLQTAIDLGMEYAIVEQDFVNNLSRKETLQGAYLNMKELGLVE